VQDHGFKGLTIDLVKENKKWLEFDYNCGSSNCAL